MSRAFQYLRIESERLAREIAAIEKKVEDLEQDPSVSFADGHLDPRYKRLIDRSEMLSTNLCEIRVKVADFVAGKKEDKPEPSASSTAAAKLKDHFNTIPKVSGAEETEKPKKRRRVHGEFQRPGGSYQGINDSVGLVGRESCVAKINDFIKDESCRSFLIMTPPATGKTSILERIYTQRRELEDDDCTFYVRFDKGESPFQRMEWILDKNGNVSVEGGADNQIVLLIDDAHSCYPSSEGNTEGDSKAAFWDMLLKSKSLSKLKVVIAATYTWSAFDELLEDGSQSLSKMNRVHFPDLLLRPEQAVGLFDNDVRIGFPVLINTIIKDCGGHIGALMVARDEIIKETRGKAIRPPEEELLCGYLRNLKGYARCFNDADLESVRDELQRCICGVNPVPIEAVKIMFRSGLITADSFIPVNFTSSIAKRYLYHSLFANRAPSDPSSLVELVLDAVSSLSSSLLTQSTPSHRIFPKEMVFQHLLMNALCMHTTANTYICPDLQSIIPEQSNSSTSPTVPSLPSSNGAGEIDFLVDGPFRWGIKLLVNGGGLTDQMLQYEPSPKYEFLKCQDYCIVDFRHTSNGVPSLVTSHEKRVVVFFKLGDYRKCTAVHGNPKQAKKINLLSS